MPDTTDNVAKVPHVVGDLHDWDSATPANLSTPVYNTVDAEFKNVAPVAAIADLVAITGGEAPTEAEHNAVRTALNSLLAACRTKGIIAT